MIILFLEFKTCFFCLDVLVLFQKKNDAESSQEENECHIFAEIDPSQPAMAIVKFVSKVMIDSVLV